MGLSEKGKSAPYDEQPKLPSHPAYNVNYGKDRQARSLGRDMASTF